ncbi:hypothetical protein [Zhongshania sp. BJYM1]|uniref:hypothetical protein n=1 Tax=Zhongshania aquatica TaxID=2965069 RepID=UPI0022B3F868|nr:hypothetical protein [Marortus sp. BJYM1]
MKRDLLILTTDKPGHYKSYGELCRSLRGRGEVLPSAPLSTIFACKKLVLIDGDSRHLLLFPVVVLRALMGRSTVFLSVRTEDFLESRIKSRIKKTLVRLLIRFHRVKFISIHYPSFNIYEGKLVSRCIYDPQLWDLPFIDQSVDFPPELQVSPGYLLVLGTLNDKRCKDELIDALPELTEIDIVFAGKMSEEDECKITRFKNIVSINRYVSDAEILGLYKRAGAVYAFYDASVMRPSGIFGRAIQNNCPVIVRSGGYLDDQYGHFAKTISISAISDLKHILKSSDIGFLGLDGCETFDHSEILRSYL